MKTIRALSCGGFLLLAVAAPALGSDIESLAVERAAGAAPAQACLGDLQEFDEMLREFGFAVLPPGGYDTFAPTGYYGAAGTPRQTIRYLREAARVFAEDGDEAACQMTLRAMQSKFDQHKDVVGLDTDDPTIGAAWRRVHLDKAVSVSEMARFMRADLLIGAEIRNLQDQNLGEIDDLVVDPRDHSIAYVLVRRGGFLGFGAKLAAVSWQDLRATEDHEIFVLDIPAATLNDAPAIEAGNFDKSTEAGWADELDRFWDAQVRDG